jgi:uncharacterized repeat protein (TIGR03803 family)
MLTGETFRGPIIRSWELGVDKDGRSNIMKILRIPLVIILIILAGRGFDANAQTVTNLYSFDGPPTDGGNPEAGLVQASDGNFYGTTASGGASNYGTVIRISPSGAETNLYSFSGPPNDGAYPFAGLVQASDGFLYGTTYKGGTSSICSPFGCGTVFRISPSGVYTSLYSFGGVPNDGVGPVAPLVQGRDGYLYGTTDSAHPGSGTIFRISTNGAYTSLYTFAGYPADGSFPLGGLAAGSDGNFYGTTEGGGTYNFGIVFRFNPSGAETNLYSFGSFPNDGNFPNAGLVQGSDGNFYGTALQGGTNNEGVVFRIGPSGTETTLYSFVGYPTDGYWPQAALVQGSDGNFYGTTSFGGTTNGGTVFQISLNGSYTSLYSFGVVTNDGERLNAGLVQGSDGSFYGTTLQGGVNGSGTVFKLTVPLNPPPYPINQITGIQLSGANVVLNVLSIAGETYQLQYRSSLTSGIWSNVPGVSITNCIGSTLALTNFAEANQLQGFYRFAITP